MDDEKKPDKYNDDQEDKESWWGWSSSWLQSAKEKSSTALEFMKRDLTEFKQVVQTDAVAAVSSTAAMLKEKLTVDNAEAVAGRAKQSITSVIGSIAEVFVPQKEIEEASELMVIQNSVPVAMDWWQAQLHKIRRDPKTFCHEPEGPPEMYESWLESFDPVDYQEEMTEVMMTCSETRALYDKLVPTSVSHLEFWHRYFYRVHLLRMGQAKRSDMLRKTDQLSSTECDNDTNRCKPETSVEKYTFADNSAICTSATLSQQTAPPLDTNTQSPQMPDSPTGKHSTEDGKKESADQRRDSASIDKDGPSTGSSTGDEDWEKDFELELDETDLKNAQPSTKGIQKEDEDDWEKWQ